MWCSQGPGNCVPCRLESASEEDTCLCCNTVVRKGLACTYGAHYPTLCCCTTKYQGVPEHPCRTVNALDLVLGLLCTRRERKPVHVDLRQGL